MDKRTEFVDNFYKKREDFKEGINSFLEKRLPNFKKIK